MDLTPNSTSVSTPTPETKGKYLLEVELQKSRMINQFRLIYALLGLTAVMNMAPVIIAGLGSRRLPDNIVNSLSQAALLITGSAGSSVAFLIGGNNDGGAKRRDDLDSGISIEPPVEITGKPPE